MSPSKIASSTEINIPGQSLREGNHNGRLQSLDVLRAVAVLLVIVSHYSLVLPNDSSIFRAAACGVDLFFVLSGFLISGLLFSEYKKTGGIRLARFWIRRGFKIYPPFYVFIAGTALVALLLSHRIPREILSEVVFVQNYFPHVWPHTWSLAVEEHFYLALPLLLVFLIKRGKGTANPFRLIPMLSVFMCGACLYLRVLALRHGSDWNHVAFPTHLRIDALFAGVALGYFAHFDKDSLHAARRVWVLVVGLFFAMLLPLLPNMLHLTCAYVASCFLVAWAANRPQSTRAPIRLLAWIGCYSYSIYLWHVVAMFVLKRLPVAWYRFPVYAGAAIVLGVLMAKFIEVPSLRVRERLMGGRVATTPVANPFLAIRPAVSFRSE